ncbi:MAG: ABC transporter substrate-binding protein, partial [Acidimicrobiia bacterium]
MRQWGWIRVVAVVAALMLVAVACDSDSDSSDDDDSGDNGDEMVDPADVDFTAGLTGDPVKIGVILEETGGALANPEIPEGAKSAQLLVNEAGGIQGRPVEIITCDTANDPNTAAECGRQMVDEGVVALSGVLSVHAGEFMPLMEENKIPSVAHTLAGVPGFTSPASFPVIGGIVATAPSVAVGVVESGATKVSTPRPDLAAGAAIPTFVTPALEAFDATYGNDVPVPELAPDMATYVQASLDGGADGIAVFLSGQDATNFVITARQSEPDIPLGTFTTDATAFREALGPDLAGIVTSSSSTCPFDSDACQQFEDSMAAAGFESSGNRQ